MVLLANTISPTLVTVPGFGLLGLHVAFTLSVLAALIERPFVTNAGVNRHPLCASLQANFFTTLVGLLCTPIAILILAFPPLIFCWWPFAAWLSYRVEYAWYRRHCKGTRPEPSRSPILWGNVVSNVVFFVLMLISPQPSVSQLRWLHSLEPELTIATAAGCAATYLAAFVIPRAYRNSRAGKAAVAKTDAPQAPAAPPVAVLNTGT